MVTHTTGLVVDTLDTYPIKVAIDPGGTTGFAVKVVSEYHTCSLTTPQELWDMLSGYKPDIVAFETFYTGGMVDINMIRTIELVGSIKGICHILKVPAHPQQPQARRAFQLDARQILRGQRGKTVHEEDALAHLLRLEWNLARGKLPK